MELTQQTRRTLLICAALSAMTLAAYWPVTGHDFLSCDDPAYVTMNAHVLKGLSWANVDWAFTDVFYDYYHPLAWLSHMLDVQLFGLNSGWHHLTSLLLHAANAVLLFVLLQRMTGAAWRSAMVAALFALHPLHVESVAWIAERKDVLSGLFFMLTLYAYARYVEVRSPKSEVRSPKGEGRENEETGNTQHATRNTFHALLYYTLALCFFACGLLSKPMLMTLPFVLLLFDYWPLRRIAERGAQRAELGTPLLQLLVEKAPFFLLAAFSCMITYAWAHNTGNYLSAETEPWSLRLANVPISYARYLGKMIWPVGLAFPYPMPSHWAWWQTGGSVLLLVVITLFVVWRARSAPYLIVGWLIFLGMLVPTIRLVHSGFQSIADRYTYLPLIGIFIAVVWGVADWGGRRRGAGGVAQPSGQDTPSGTPAPRAALGAAGAGVLLVCAALTIRQVSWWHDTLRLFQHALDVTGDNYMAHNNLAGYLYLRGHLDEAIAHYQASLAEEPGQTHQLEIHYYLGDALSKRGRYAEAAEQFSEVLQAQPENAAALAQLGTARARQGKLDEAARVLSEAVRIQPGDAAAHNSLGNVLAEQGKPEEAVRQFEEAARLKPDHAAAHNNLALSLSKLGRTGDAISQYREAIRLQPDFLAALNNLAWLLAAQPDARFRNGAEAVQLATRACELTKYQNPTALATLAAAYAETGRFREAVSFAEQAQGAAKGGQGVLAERLAAMLAAYRAGRAYYAE